MLHELIKRLGVEDPVGARGSVHALCLAARSKHVETEVCLTGARVGRHRLHTPCALPALVAAREP